MNGKELDNQLNSNRSLENCSQRDKKSYEKERNRKYKQITVSPIGGVGGAVNSIKCLHSHLADELVTENIVGQIVLENVEVVIVMNLVCRGN